MEGLASMDLLWGAWGQGLPMSWTSRQGWVPGELAAQLCLLGCKENRGKDSQNLGHADTARIHGVALNRGGQKAEDKP